MKFIRFYLTAFFLIVTSVSYSQVSTKQIQEIFSQAAPFTWAMPVPNSSPIPLEWHERSTSMASEGIRSFVGYYQNQLVATLSISGLNVSGTYSYGTISYEITSIKKKLLFIKEEEGKCDTKDTHLEDLPMLQKVSSITQRDANTPKIENTNVLRVYRLAMTITNSTYTHSIINKDINKVYTFWANTELFLNEVYTRDIGVRFEVVKDDRLIITDPSKDNFTKRNAYYAVDNHTQYLNETIGETSYDVGICVSFSTSAGLRGLAYVNAAYTTLKAGAFARPIKETIAHELGHMFGAIHTFSGPTSDPSSDKTEYYTGTSVMSYGTPRNFFSLSSIETIRKILAGIPYYTDKERTNVVGDSSFANIPFGIPLNSQPPRIDDSQIQPEYIIPENTFFQFYVSATDPDSNTLYYTANQHDPRKGSSYSITQYMIYKPSTKNPVTFQREYRKETGTIEHNSWLSTQNTGTFTFWISANDSQPNSAHNYITQYDLMETKVTIKEGIPFALERLKKKAYKGGEKVQLTWKVDKTIFDEHSKVRILLSEDFGETFPYILSESTENDGSQEVTLPNIQIGKKRFGASPINAPAGVIKVEVIQGLAFALTDYNPNNGGGFTIEKDYNIKDELAFVTTPKSITLQCKELIPEVVFPTFQGGCNPKITYKDQLIDKKCENQYTIERTFTLSDECNQSLTYTQYIKIEDNTPPTFVGTLPKDISVSSNQIPQQGEVSATDNCNGAVTIQKLREEVKDANQNITKVIYKWIASDICGNESIYTQSIQIDKKPLKWENLPKNYTLNCWNTTTNTQSEDFTTKKYLLTKNSEDFINKKYPLTKNSEDFITKKYPLTKNSEDFTTKKYPLTKNSEDFTTKKYPTTKNIGDFTNKNTLPEVEFPTFSGGCNPKITYKDQIIDKKCENQYTIQRTFTLSDECNQPLTYTQYIKIEDNTPPTFVGTLPKDTSVSSNQIPEQAEVTAIDSCNGGVTIQKLREEIKDANQNIIKVIYKWIASDVCGNKSTHTQVISITQEPLELLTTPSDITLNCNEPMPDVVFPTFKGGCSPNISYKEEIVDRKCDNQYTLLRTFTISDRCNNSVVYSQRIYKVANLTFELGTLPPKNTESTLSSLPPQGEISASNSCAGNISIRKYQKQVLDSQHQVVKVLNNWVASDDCGNEITYTQVVSILPEPSKPENTTPSDSQQANEPIVYNAVSTSNDSMNYFKIENVDTSYPIYLDIFNELGQLVYHSSNYQKNGEVFKGYANVRNAISKGSLLESGVYFYVLKYHSPKGEAIKKGFLFIR